MAKKRVLMVATVPSMIGQFNRSNIDILQNMGYEVHVAADFTDMSVWPIKRVERFKDEMNSINVLCFQVDFSRNLIELNCHIKSLKQIEKLVDEYHYSFIHTHTPIASVITRIVAHKTGTRVIYTAHGFHFYKGAPLKNWLIFYPVEKWMSRYTDVLITINKEDYKRASAHFHAKKTVYIPGVGVDTDRFKPRESGRKKIRTELGLAPDEIMLLSVGELNENKNHEAVIRAISGLDFVYVIVGRGGRKERLEQAAVECRVDLRLTGFRADVADFYDAADVYILPSMREGLNVSLMEAMASGLPIACARIRGNTDLIDEPLFAPTSIDEIRRAVKTAIEKKEELGNRNIQKIRSFDLHRVNGLVSEIYRGGYGHLAELLKRQKKRTEIDIPLDAKLLISIGELSARKNHKVVVEALQKLPSEFWYVIVGRGSFKAELERLDHTGHLKLLGYRNDIVELLHASDVFVFPSLQEGLPVALMEALAAGLPCVASRIRGNTDLIEDGEGKLLFNPMDHAEVADCLYRVLNNVNREYTKSNAENMIKFDISNVNKNVRDIYAILLQ